MTIAFKHFPSLPAEDYRKVVRPQVRSGDMLLCSGSAMMSRMIQGATKSVWSHVAFIIRLESIGRVMVLESVESIGVRTVPLSHYVRDYNGTGKGYHGKLLIARHDDFAAVDPNKLKAMSQFAIDLFGYPYDKQEILRIAGRIMQDALGLSDKEVRSLSRDRTYICSEYAWECYNAVGIAIAHNPRGYVAPCDFATDAKVKAVSAVKVEN